MNWNATQERWHMIIGAAKERWNRFSEQELHAIAGKRDALIQKLKEKYGMSQQQAEREADEFHESQSEAGKPQTRTSGGGQ